MRLDAIRLRHVRGFGEEGVALEGFAPGLNILSAPNEFGKSTLFDALRAALFYGHTRAPKEIKSLEPDPGGGAPEVTLELTTKEGRFRIDKRFLRKRMATVTDLGSGRVVAEADDAERWIRGVIGADRPGEGPAGLLWVEQGASLRQPDAAEGRGEAVLGLLGREVQDVTDGERSRHVLARATEALEALVTAQTRKPKAGSPYARAIEAAEALRSEVAALTAAVSASRSLREELARTEDALRRVEDEERSRERSERLAAAEAQLGEARDRRAGLAALNIEAERSAASAREAEEALSALRDEQAAAREAQRTLGEAAERAELAGGRRKDAVAALDAARAESAAAAEKARKAEGALAEARRAQQAAQAREGLERLLRDLSAAQAARSALRALGPPAPLPDLSELEDRHTRLLQAEARAEAARARLVVEATDGRLRLDGMPLDAGAERPLSAQSVITAGAGIRFRVETPAGAAEEALDAARAAYREALHAAGAENLDGARRSAAEAREREAQRGRLKESLERLAPKGFEALEDEVEALRTLAKTAEEALPVAEAEADHEEASRALHEAAGRAEALRDAADAAREAQARIDGDLRVAEARWQDALSRLGPEDNWPEVLSAQEVRLGTAREAAEAAARTLREQEAALPDLAVLEAEVKRLRQAVANARDEADRLRQDRARMTTELRHHRAEGAEERLAEAEGQLEAAEAEEARYARQVRALTLLAETLSRAQTERRDRFLAPVTAELAPLLGSVFGAGALQLGDDLSPETFLRDGADEPVERLSGGTREQLAILTRLAFARLMAKNGRPMPVILDDALVFADDDRIARMFTALNLAASDVQVIALSCRQRVFDDLGGTRIRPRPLNGLG